jgi:uncharacterized RmlC-like cupin family protein
MESTMTETIRWQDDGVKIVRAAALADAMAGGPGMARATAFDFAGSGGRATWIGAVSLPPGARTGAHHHGRHEVAVYVVRGRGAIRWGERLEFAAEVGAGDFVYFTPHVPHEEQNLDAAVPLDFVVVRSDNERIAVALDIRPDAEPARTAS